MLSLRCSSVRLTWYSTVLRVSAGFENKSISNFVSLSGAKCIVCAVTMPLDEAELASYLTCWWWWINAGWRFDILFANLSNSVMFLEECVDVQVRGYKFRGMRNRVKYGTSSL